MTELRTRKLELREQLLGDIVSKAVGRLYRAFKIRKHQRVIHSCELHSLVSCKESEPHPVLSQMVYRPYWLDRYEPESDCDINDPAFIEVELRLLQEKGGFTIRKVRKRDRRRIPEAAITSNTHRNKRGQLKKDELSVYPSSLVPIDGKSFYHSKRFLTSGYWISCIDQLLQVSDLGDSDLAVGYYRSLKTMQRLMQTHKMVEYKTLQPYNNPTTGLFAGHQFTAPDVERTVRAMSNLLEEVDRDVYELELVYYYHDQAIMQVFLGGSSQIPWGLVKNTAYGTINNSRKRGKRVQVELAVPLTNSETKLLSKSPRGLRILEESKEHIQERLHTQQNTILKAELSDGQDKYKPQPQKKPTGGNSDRVSPDSGLAVDLEELEDIHSSTVYSDSGESGSDSSSVLGTENEADDEEMSSERETSQAAPGINQNSLATYLSSKVRKDNVKGDNLGLSLPAADHYAALEQLARKYNSEDENQGFPASLSRLELEQELAGLHEVCVSYNKAVVLKGMDHSPRELSYLQTQADKMFTDAETLQEVFKLVLQNRALYYALLYRAKRV